jgi:hypothetical protein
VLGISGATALLWITVPLAQHSKRLVRVLGTLRWLSSGLAAQRPPQAILYPVEKKKTSARAVDKANRLCNSLWAMKPIAQQPKGMVFTFVDLGPRLITVTHTDAVTGPYHRNGEQIADVMKAFRGSEAQARRSSPNIARTIC